MSMRVLTSPNEQMRSANVTEKPMAISLETIERSIFIVRRHKVMLDKTLAALYRVSTKASQSGGEAEYSPISARFHDPIGLGGGAGLEVTICDLERKITFKVTNCDLDSWQERQISPLRVHRARHCDVVKRAQKRAGCTSQHSD